MAVLTENNATSSLGELPDWLDASGYMKEPTRWNWDIAQGIAYRERVGELTADYRRIIEYIRTYYENVGAWPMPVRIAKDLGINRRHLCRRSPEVWFKIAGIPNPGRMVWWDVRKLGD